MFYGCISIGITGKTLFCLYRKVLRMNEYVYDELRLGMKESFSVCITEQMIADFASITGDYNPLHQDGEYALSAGYNGRVVYGMLTSSFLSTLAGMYLPGKYSVIHETTLKMPKPVYIGDELRIEGEITDKNDIFRIIDIKVNVYNRNNVKVLRGSMRVGVLA